MEVTELRIGNLVKMNNRIIVMDNRIFHAVIHGFKGYEPKPIPLTRELILKFGFEETEFCFRLGTFFLTKSKQAERYLYQAHQNRFVVMHVHHLQNLYFALYEEELVFNN